MKATSRRFNAQQWCHLSKIDDGRHSLLITDVEARGFYGGQYIQMLGGHEMNTFTVGYNTDDSIPSFNDPLFLRCFENSLLDYTYHTIFIDLPDRLCDPDSYKDGICKMLDLIKEHQPNAYLVYVDSVTVSHTGRELCEARGGRYLDMLGKSRAELDKAAAEISKLPLKERIASAMSVRSSELDDVRESMYWCVNDMDDYTDDDKRKRILLVGDSICFGYYHKTRELLTDDFIVDTYAMSFAAADPALIRNMLPVLHAHKYDAIHLNVGMHFCNRDMQDGVYEESIRNIFSTLKRECPDTKLSFATLATISRGDDLSKFDDATFGWVTDRNNAAKRVCKELSLSIDDIFTLCVEKNPKKFDPFHFTDYTLLAEQVSKHIRELFE